ncbi:PAS domain S-box [Planoprotostelium fungivorum]|uniref:PAS domain S-box n=1 Tax=Planoprotostelium fungivorum TaxID=1890364 RepID=A0A2P6MY37_9EUKA|nr:PAS domain S-box [Planoprotostelium fungivorum]
MHSPNAVVNTFLNFFSDSSSRTAANIRLIKESREGESGEGDKPVTIREANRQKKEKTGIEAIRLSMSIVESVRQVTVPCIRRVISILGCPEHILVNRSANLVKLCDSISRIHLPEQTGRMKQDVDFRTDYHTIGVVMYRPCTAHLLPHRKECRSPVQQERREELTVEKVPKTLSNIITKLLSKNAIVTNQPSDFDRIWRAVPEAVRKRIEMKALLDVFESVATNKGHNRLAIVSGFSHLISGKIDQYAKNIPHSSVCQSLTENGSGDDRVSFVFETPSTSVHTTTFGKWTGVPFGIKKRAVFPQIYVNTKLATVDIGHRLDGEPLIDAF